MEKVLCNKRDEKIYSRADLIIELEKITNKVPNPWEPSDYCYNITNKGILNYEKQLHLFEKVSHSKYKVLGKNYSYTGDVIDKAGNCVGKLERGKLQLV